MHRSTDLEDLYSTYTVQNVQYINTVCTKVSRISLRQHCNKSSFIESETVSPIEQVSH